MVQNEFKKSRNHGDPCATLPNFLIIGAGKAGTTSLAAQLKEHPEIYISEVKEPHYFDRNWEHGVSWYLRHFEGAEGFTAIGEASVTYTLYPVCQDVPLRIRDTLGSNIKLIYIVRNPVDRLISHYRHDILNSNISANISLEQALESNIIYRSGSNYFSQISKYLEYFDPKQIKIILFEEYISDPVRVNKEVFKFLGVDDDYVVANLEPVNVSSQRVRLPLWLVYMIRLGHLPIIKPFLKAMNRVFGVRGILTRAFGYKPRFSDIDDKYYNELFDEFNDEIMRLSEFTSIQLSDIWFKRLL